MAQPFRTVRLVEFHDTDMAGIMHFASFFQYMESAEHELIRSLGFSVHSAIGSHTISFPRVAASCQFKSAARCEEELDISVTVSRIGTKSITYDFLFMHQQREVATGTITCVCCQVEVGAPLVSVPIPAELVEKLEQYVA